MRSDVKQVINILEYTNKIQISNQIHVNDLLLNTFEHI